jgi:putative endopeptidase
MKILTPAVLLLAAASLFSACDHAKKSSDTNQKPDVLRANMDTTVDPGTDFYLYANGGWLKHNPIPETESRWGIGNLVQEEIYVRLRKISEDAAANKSAAKNSAEQRIGDLYSSAMDSAAIDKAGIAPLKPELDQIAAIKDMQGVINEIALQQQYRVGPAFFMVAAQDEKNSDLMDMHLMQGGLGLPNRDYYLNNDSRTKNIREEYGKYMRQTLEHIGETKEAADKKAADIMSLETALAKASRKLEDLRDPYANYHKMSVKDLDKLTPTINWASFFSSVGAPAIDSVVVGQPEFFTALDKAFKTYTVDQWKDYLRWQLVSNYASKLGGDFDTEHFHFYNTVLTGAKKQKPRWKRVIDYENAAIGEPLGQAFVKEYFPEKSKERYRKLVDAVMDAYKNRLQQLSWMSPATKERAVNKLNTVTKKIGFPDKWKDLTGLDISKQPFVRNAINIDKFWFGYNIRKIGKPVDRTEWDMNPQEYNAYYNPSNNEIVLPAACFAVPGYKDDELDDATVYGYAAGSTIGHEITHGFDDQGRQFDEKGNLKNWWTKEDASRFKENADKYIAQFNSYVVLDSMHINGKATIGENIADLGGIEIGLDAFKKTEQYKSGQKVAGLTPLQRYFLGYALGWMVQQRNERLANQILTDVHAPAAYRVNGPLSNIPEFYEAFHIKPGAKLYRDDSSRVVIW